VETDETEILKQALSDERNKNANLSFDIEKVKTELLEHKDKHKEYMIELAHVAESLSSCQDRCNSLEDERNSLLERLSSQKQALAGMQNAKICVDLSEDDAESVEFMREKIIALATALEKSEQARAESIDRLSIERRKHADSLRKVSENVKRFYSTLTKSHPTMGS
jgi:chromosome segregation ATPase